MKGTAQYIEKRELIIEKQSPSKKATIGLRSFYPIMIIKLSHYKLRKWIILELHIKEEGGVRNNFEVLIKNYAASDILRYYSYCGDLVIHPFLIQQLKK